MKNAILFLLVSVFTQLHAQQNFHTLDITTSNAVAPGYYLLAPNSTDSIGLTDHTGRSVFRIRTGTVTNLRAYGAKYLTYYTSRWQSNTGCFVRKDHNLETVDSLFLEGDYLVDFHEGRIWSDTSYIILGTERRTIDMSQFHHAGRADAIVLGAVIQERGFDGQVIFEWKSFDHIPVTDATDDVDLASALIDYIHVNSVERSSDGHLLVSCRHLDAVIKINSTNGSVIWRLGGSASKNTTFTIANDAVGTFSGFSHQHSAFETPRGTIMLFDNGNLKPAPRVSRAVEYQLDLSTYTATKIWEHNAPSSIYSTAMGSVEELVNGNVLVNYGATEGSSRKGMIIAEEIKRNGQVVATIKNTSQSEITSYRVMKSTFGMAGCDAVISTPGTTVMSCNDSTTNVSLEITTVATPTAVVVERHNYLPHNISFMAEPYCGTLPLRWVVKIADSLSLKGALWFNTGDISAIQQAERMQLLYRPVEGQGAFAVIDAAYNAQQQKFRVGKLVSGEFMLAYRECLEPAPLKPVHAATEVDSVPMVSWKAAAINNGYEVDVSGAPSFSTYTRFTTKRTDTTMQGLRLATTYYWRVRRVYDGDAKGPWSETFRFTTMLGIPVPISPVLKRDTVAISVLPTFRWTKAEGAERYRVVVADRDLGQPVVNQVTTADSLVLQEPLLYNMAYTWTVSSMRGTVVGRPSVKHFIVTIPAAPELSSPANDTLIAFAQAQYFSWKSVPGALRYAITVKKRSTGAILQQDTVAGLWAVLHGLPQKTEFAWTVQAIGRYGAGARSKEFYFNTYSTVPLAPPVVISPKNIDNVDATEPIRFAWSAVPDATSYRLQVTSTPDFRDVATDTVIQDLTCTRIGWLPGTAYSWRVMAMNEHVVSRWSDTARFITAPTGATALVPLWPRLASTGVPTTGIVRYSTSPEFTRYTAEFSRSSDFEDIDLTFASSTSTTEYGQLRERTTYYWRAIGERADGTRATGPHSMFTTAYETVGVDTEGNETGYAEITAGAGAVSIGSAYSVSARYRLLNIAGQTLSHGTIEPGCTIVVPVVESGAVFVEVIPHADINTSMRRVVMVR